MYLFFESYILWHSRGKPKVVKDKIILANEIHWQYKYQAIKAQHSGKVKIINRFSDLKRRSLQ
jgi:hypothetical protein